MTRFPDRKRVEVAAGQYTVAGDGVELAALPLDDASAAGRSSRRGRRNMELYGRVLFEDNFDDTLSHWDVVTGTEVDDLKTVTDDSPVHVRIERDYSEVRRCEEVLSSCVVLDAQAGVDRFAGIRLKQPIEAERFVVEMRFGMLRSEAATGSDRKRGTTRFWHGGVDIPRGNVMNIRFVKQPPLDVSRGGMHICRWEYTPAPDGTDALECRYFEGYSRDPDEWDHWNGELMGTWRVPTKRPNLLFGVHGWSWDLVIDRVLVREMNEL
jgi:hypothetical protein